MAGVEDLKERMFNTEGVLFHYEKHPPQYQGFDRAGLKKSDN
jgi:hypothetical protein